jgi:lipopolysaccharide transport protein LptA
MKTFLFIVAVLLSVVTPNISMSAEGYLGDSNLFVVGDKWEFKNKESKVIIQDKVKAKNPDFELQCEELIVHFENPSGQSNLVTTAQNVEEVNALNNVVILMNNGYTAFSDKADYSKKNNLLILSGNARIKSATNDVKGCVITYHTDTGAYEIDSCPDQSAKGSIKKN